MSLGPLDVVKVRLQNQGPVPKGQQPKSHGTYQTLTLIHNEEGVRGLFRGLGVTTIAYIMDRAIWFAAYNYIKRGMAKSAGV